MKSHNALLKEVIIIVIVITKTALIPSKLGALTTGARY